MMGRMHWLALAVPLAIGTAACASGGSATQAGSEATPQLAALQRRGSPNVITQAEIAESGASTALQAIQRLRANMLNMRGAAGGFGNAPDPGIVIYSDNVKIGSISSSDKSVLEGILASDVARIEFLNSQDATQRFGTGHIRGAILITRRSR